MEAAEEDKLEESELVAQVSYVLALHTYFETDFL